MFNNHLNPSLQRSPQRPRLLEMHYSTVNQTQLPRPLMSQSADVPNFNRNFNLPWHNGSSGGGVGDNGMGSSWVRNPFMRR